MDCSDKRSNATVGKLGEEGTEVNKSQVCCSPQEQVIRSGSTPFSACTWKIFLDVFYWYGIDEYQSLSFDIENKDEGVLF